MSKLTDRSHATTTTTAEVVIRTQSDFRANRYAKDYTLHQIARDGLDKMLVHKLELLMLEVKSKKHVVAAINELDEDDLTPLHLAARFGRANVISTLVKQGADINNRDNVDQLAPIHLATKNNHAHVVSLLVDLGADPNIPDSGMFTPLHWAVSKGHKSCVVALVGHSATKVNATDNDGTTPLHQACMNGNTDLCYLLLQSNADLMARSEQKDNCFHYCSSEGVARTIIQFVADRSQPSSNLTELIRGKNALENTPLHDAVTYDRIRLAKLLLENGADSNAIGADGQTPLHIAAFRGNVEMIDLLILYKADINATDEYMSTPLHLSCEAQKNFQVTQHLIERYGAEIDVMDAQRRTPLHVAAAKGSRHHVAYLVSHGASTDQVDESEQTVLHIAVHGNHFLTARLLLGIVPRFPKLFNEDGKTIIPWTSFFVKPLRFKRRAAAKTTILRQIPNIFNVEENSGNFLFQHVATLSAGEPITCSSRIRHLYSPSDTLPRAVYESQPVVAWGITWAGFFRIFWEQGDVESTIATPKRILVPGVGTYDPAGEHPCINENDMRIILPYLLCLISAASLGCTHKHLELLTKDMQPLAKACGRLALLDWMLHQVVCTMVLDCKTEQYPDYVADLLLDADETGVVLVQDRQHTQKFLRAWSKQRALKNSERTLLPPREFFRASNIHKFEHVHVDVTDNYGDSALHIAAQGGFSLLCRLLVERGANVELTNDCDQTPLHIACEMGFLLVAQELVKSLLGTSTEASDSDSEGTSDATVTGRGTGSVITLLGLEDDHGSTPLHVACSKGHEELVSFLLENGADFSARDLNGRTPLHVAAKGGHLGVTRLLIEAEAPLETVDKMKHTPLHLAAAQNHVDVMWLLLNSGSELLAVNQDGFNLVDIAVDSGSLAAVLSLITELPESDFSAVMQNYSTDANRMSVMGRMVTKLPAAAVVALDRCRTTSGTIDSENYRINYRFDFVDSPLPPNKNKLDNTTLELMVKYQRKEIMNHEVIQKLIDSKWNRFGRWLFILNIAQYLVFVFCLTTYMLSPGVPTFVSPSFPTDGWGFPDHYAAASGTIALVIAIMRLAKEVLEVRTQGVRYLTDETNALDIFIFCSALVIILSHVDDPQDPKSKRAWDLYVVTLFFSLANLILFVRRIATLGIYVFMFRVVFVTFTKVVAVVALFSASFTLAFFVALQNANSNFRNIGDALLKILVMFVVGEYQFEDLFELGKKADRLQGCDADECSVYGQIRSPEITKIAFAAFLILMPLLLTNLLVGLAVGDIALVQEQAKLTSCTIQTHLITDIERSMGKTMFEKLHVFKPSLQEFPNKNQSSFWNIFAMPFQTTFGQTTDTRTVIDAETEALQNRLQHLQTTISDLEISARRCEATYRKTAQSLQLACDKLGVFRARDEFD